MVSAANPLSNATVPSAEMTVNPFCGVTQKYTESNGDPALDSASTDKDNGAQTGWAHAEEEKAKSAPRVKKMQVNRAIMSMVFEGLMGQCTNRGSAGITSPQASQVRFCSLP